MRRMRVGAGAEFDATDVLAAALLDYAWALIDHRRRDVVRIPVRQPDGRVHHLDLALGPSTDLSVESIPGDEDRIDDLLVVDLRHRATRLRVETALALEDDRSSGAPLDEP